MYPPGREPLVCKTLQDSQECRLYVYPPKIRIKMYLLDLNIFNINHEQRKTKKIKKKVFLFAVPFIINAQL